MADQNINSLSRELQALTRGLDKHLKPSLDNTGFMEKRSDFQEVMQQEQTRSQERKPLFQARDNQVDKKSQTANNDREAAKEVKVAEHDNKPAVSAKADEMQQTNVKPEQVVERDVKTPTEQERVVSNEPKQQEAQVAELEQQATKVVEVSQENINKWLALLKDPKLQENLSPEAKEILAKLEAVLKQTGTQTQAIADQLTADKEILDPEQLRQDLMALLNNSQKAVADLQQQVSQSRVELKVDDGNQQVRDFLSNLSARLQQLMTQAQQAGATSSAQISSTAEVAKLAGLEFVERVQGSDKINIQELLAGKLQVNVVDQSGQKARIDMKALQNVVSETISSDRFKAAFKNIASTSPATQAATANFAATLDKISGNSTALGARAGSFGAPVHAQSQQFGQMIGANALWMIGQNKQAASLQIHPPELGGMLDVRVRMEGEQAHIQFVAPNTNVQNTLMDTFSRLQEMMQKFGIEVNEENVSYQQQQEQANQQAANGEGDGNHQGTGQNGVADNAVEQQDVTQVLRTKLGIIDDYA